MKKLFALLLALAVVGSIALADPASLTGCSVSSGVVNAVNYIDITAPFSGTLQPFTWEAGDLVNAGDLLFSMRTTPRRMRPYRQFTAPRATTLLLLPPATAD